MLKTQKNITQIEIYPSDLALRLYCFVEIPFKNVLMVRWVSGIGALLLVSFVLQSYGFQLFLLPWLPIGIIIHGAYGFMISQKHTKVHIMCNLEPNWLQSFLAYYASHL